MMAWFIAAGFALLGLGAGWLHFAGLARNVAQLTGGLDSIGRTLALAFLRFGVSATVMLAAVQFGAATLIAALAGWLLARTLRLRAVKRQADAPSEVTP